MSKKPPAWSVACRVLLGQWGGYGGFARVVYRAQPVCVKINRERVTVVKCKKLSTAKLVRIRPEDRHRWVSCLCGSGGRSSIPSREAGGLGTFTCLPSTAPGDGIHVLMKAHAVSHTAEEVPHCHTVRFSSKVACACTSRCTPDLRCHVGTAACCHCRSLLPRPKTGGMVANTFICWRGRSIAPAHCRPR